MNKIKIAHVLDSVGGVEVYLRLITENMNSDIFENIIIHKVNKDKKPYYNKSNTLIKEFDIVIQREISFFKDIKAVYQTIKVLKKEKPDVIHAHSAKGGIIARLASLIYKVNVLHTPHAYSYLSANSKFKSKLFLVIEQIFKNFNSYLLATSESEKLRGIKDVGYSKDRVFVLNNSILPISKQQKENQLRLPDEYICTVGRPSFQKNLEMMIEVIKLLKRKQPNIFLVIMGVGEYSPNKESIKALIKAYKLENNIKLIEWMEREKIFQIISKSKIYISTSRYEGLPYSIIESLALSKACVVTDCDGNRDLIKDNYNGYVVGLNDMDLMSEKIYYLLRNKDIREKFEKNSFNYFEKNFNLKKNIKKLENIYNNFNL